MPNTFLDVKEGDTVVLESSSFQLEGANKFSPYISVLTNVAPDHLDYHGTFKNYCKAKTNNFRLQREKDFSISTPTTTAHCKCPSKVLPTRCTIPLKIPMPTVTTATERCASTSGEKS